MQYLEGDLKSQEWYERLVDDCKSIITEAVFTSRWALVEGYWNLGERVQTDENFKKYAKGNLKAINDLAKDIEVSETTIYYAMQFYEKYPDLDKVPEGKNITWNKLITKYLPETKKNKEKKYLNSEAEQRFSNYIKKSRPCLQITKKGLPDFMIIKNRRVVGFVEVKRSDLNDCLTEEQNYFRLFCREHNIPYQVWSPMMASERWEKGGKEFKLAFTYGGEIWDKI